MGGGLELDDLEGPFQPKPFYDSMIQDFSCERFSPRTLKWYMCVISSEEQKATSVPWNELPNPMPMCATVI